MSMVRRGALVAILLGSVTLAGPVARAADTSLLTSVPSLGFPFFVHMMKALEDEA